MECGFVFIDGALKPINQAMANDIAREFKEGQFISGKLTVTKSDKMRTLLQNKSMHLFFKLVAIAANESGMDIRRLMSQKIDIQCTPENIKETVWKPVQEALFNKTHTSKLEKNEVSEVYRNIDRYLLQKNGINVPFPSMESQYFESQTS